MCPVTGLEHMNTGSVAKRLTLSRNTNRRLKWSFHTKNIWKYFWWIKSTSIFLQISFELTIQCLLFTDLCVCTWIWCWQCLSSGGFNRGFMFSLILRSYYFILLSYINVHISTKYIYIFFLSARGGGESAPVPWASKNMVCVAQKISHFLFELWLCKLVDLLRCPD